MTITTDVISPLSGGPAAIPALNWQVWVNWADDGIWGTEDVDISDDVLGLRWVWGRRGLPVPEFAAPARLELTLNNADHRYTPGNDWRASLGTNVRPGREVRLRASRLHDDFATSGAGSEDLDKRKTAFGDGSWEVIATAGNGFSVLAGEVRGAAGSPPPSDAVALLDTGDATATLTARYRRATNGQGGFVLRCVAANNCLRLRFDHTASVLERVAGSTVTQLASGSTLAVGSLARPGNRADGGQRSGTCHQPGIQRPCGPHPAGGQRHCRSAGLRAARAVAQFPQHIRPLGRLRRGPRIVPRAGNRHLSRTTRTEPAELRRQT